MQPLKYWLKPMFHLGCLCLKVTHSCGPLEGPSLGSGTGFQKEGGHDDRCFQLRFQLGSWSSKHITGVFPGSQNPPVRLKPHLGPFRHHDRGGLRKPPRWFQVVASIEVGEVLSHMGTLKAVQLKELLNNGVSMLSRVSQNC